MRSVIFILVFFFSMLANAQSFFGGGTFSKRGDSENVRWTLADWMTQKKDFKIMDQWLAVNKQTNFLEFNIEGGQSNYDLTVGSTVTKQKVTTMSAQLWVSIFGLQYTKQDSDEDWEAESYQLNIRLLGQSSRTTSLTAFYGQRDHKDIANNIKYDNAFGGAKLNLYIVSVFGIEGSYRKDLAATDNTGREIEGERSDYGVFLDLNFVRIYGNVFTDKTTITQTGVPSEQKRDGIDAGVKFFF